MLQDADTWRVLLFWWYGPDIQATGNALTPQVWAEVEILFARNSPIVEYGLHKVTVAEHWYLRVRKSAEQPFRTTGMGSCLQEKKKEQGEEQ